MTARILSVRRAFSARAAALATVVAMAMTWAASPTLADYRDLVGYADLEAELGPGSVPTGDMDATQVEAPTSAGDYAPNPANSEFLTPDKDIVEASGASGPSGHATAVGINYFGNDTSVAPDLGLAMNGHRIAFYEANNWIGAGFLNTGGLLPNSSTDRVANHSWVGDAGDAADEPPLGDVSPDNPEILRRVDYVVETDDVVQVAAVPNAGMANFALPKDAYNVISVGRTDGNHITGTTSVDPIYTSGRVAPDIVAPGLSKSETSTTTSWAAPMVASSVALLVDASTENPSFSGAAYTSPRSGNTIRHGDTSEVIKALLMAGADREVDNRSGTIDDWGTGGHMTANGLDDRYGAGQINVYQSYMALAAGEQDSAEDGGSGIGPTGWDYDPAFGGSGGSNAVATYTFTADAADGDTFIASLVWNVDVQPAANTITENTPAVLYDLDLLLAEVGGSVLFSSDSSDDNTENIFFEGLVGGTEYELRVVQGSGQDDFEWDYGLAWQTTPEPATLALLGLGGVGLALGRRRT